MRSTSRRALRTVFLFAFALLIWGVSDRPQALAQGQRSSYFPEVKLKTQDGKEVRFYEDLIKGKIFVINFFYTRCDGEL